MRVSWRGFCFVIFPFAKVNCCGQSSKCGVAGSDTACGGWKFPIVVEVAAARRSSGRVVTDSDAVLFTAR